MSRVFKTRYPCTNCGAETTVRRLADVPHAHCPTCAERRRLLSLGNLCDDLAQRRIDDANRDATSPEAARLALFIHAAETKLHSARAFAEAVAVAKPSERRRLLRIARGRARWAADVLAQLGVLVAGALIEESHGLEVVDGGGEDAPPAPVPLLRVVKGDAQP